MGLTPLVMVDCRIYYDSVDLTGFSNKIEAKASAEELNKTTFGSGGWTELVGGLFDSEATVDTIWQAGDTSYPDDTYWANLGTNTKPLTLIPSPTTLLTAPTVGDLAYVNRVLEAEYTITGDTGKLLMSNTKFKGNWPFARGAVLHPHGTARTTTANGTPVQLGALSSTQRLYAALHVLSIAGTSTPTITVKIQSAATSGGSYTDRITYTAATAIGGQASSVDGAVTDSWWRAQWTITGSSPSFLFAVSAGIASK